jgi:hypothetical protein
MGDTLTLMNPYEHDPADFLDEARHFKKVGTRPALAFECTQPSRW